MKTLGPTRMLSAAGQRTDLPLDTQWAQRLRWEQQGYELPPWDPPMVGPVAQAKNASKAAAKSAKRVLTRKPVLASAERVAEVLAICNDCPTKRLRESDRRCSACGCYVDAKAQLAAESCPDGHWAAVEVPRRKKPVVAAAKPKPKRKSRHYKTHHRWKENNPGCIMDHEIDLVVGITAAPQRISTTLPSTINSLRNSGFKINHIFLDGDDNCDFDIPVTSRHSPIGPYGNFVLGLQELFLRYRHASKFAIFQDDGIAVKNLKAYLDRYQIPENSWLNLMNHETNDKKGRTNGTGWFKTSGGLGAIGLVFPREVVHKLLFSPDLFRDIRESESYPCHIDMSISRILIRQGCQELCHFPSLMQHIGTKSTLRLKVWDANLAKSFPGQHFNALSLIGENNG